MSLPFPHYTNILSSLREDNPDLIVQVSDGQVLCHKAVLACHSNLLKDVLLHDYSNILFLPDFGKKEILNLVEFLYGNVTETFVSKLLLKTLGIDVHGMLIKQAKNLHIAEVQQISYQCSLCNLVCSSLEDWGNHMDIHSDERMIIDDIDEAVINDDFVMAKDLDKIRLMRLFEEASANNFEEKITEDIEENDYLVIDEDVKVQNPEIEPTDFDESINSSFMPTFDDALKAPKNSQKKRKHAKSENNEKESTRYKCFRCPKDFASKNGLWRHIDTKHVEVRKPQPIPCDLCEATFTVKTDLVVHMENVHMIGNKLYKCNYCDFKRLNNSHVVKEHERIHTDEKPEICQWCGKGFRHKKTLKHHEMLHTGEKPYKCKFCNSAFVQRNSLNVHLKCHHKQEWLDLSKKVQEEEFIRSANNTKNLQKVKLKVRKSVKKEKKSVEESQGSIQTVLKSEPDENHNHEEEINGIM